ncbi:MAG: hypothetical protein N3B13_04340, partial [Deltaproteobacteria bacterium]|nr:hypothetical protein [Deltaproteobacteria bacterium]
MVNSKTLIFTIVFVLIAPFTAFTQESPKKPVKITEETVNQICTEAINKYFNEERPKLIEENKKITEEAVKASQEEIKKMLEELEKRIIEVTEKNIQEKSKNIADESAKAKIDEYAKQKAEAEKIKAVSGPGFIYDEDTVFRFSFETLIRGELSNNLTDYNSSEDDSEMKILQRTVFGGSVSYKNRISATYKLRHTQVWGDQNLNIFTESKTTSIRIPTDTIYTSLYRENHGLGTYEASLEIGNFREIPLTLQAGLLQLHYGDGRFLGADKKWFIESEPHTAALLKYRINNHNLHLIYSKIRESEVLRINNKLYKTPGDDLIGLYYTSKLTDDIQIDGYGFYNRTGPDAVSYTH